MPTRQDRNASTPNMDEIDLEAVPVDSPVKNAAANVAGAVNPVEVMPRTMTAA